MRFSRTLCTCCMWSCGLSALYMRINLFLSTNPPTGGCLWTLYVRWKQLAQASVPRISLTTKAFVPSPYSLFCDTPVLGAGCVIGLLRSFLGRKWGLGVVGTQEAQA